MILGVDIGSYATKSSKRVSFQSRVSKIGNILGNEHNFTLNGEEFFIEEGIHDTEYRKLKRENMLQLLYASLVLSDCDKDVQLVLGLPISQYNTDKEKLMEKIKKNNVLKGTYNGIKHEFFIRDVAIYPEAVGAVPSSFNGIVVDIGGRTTDVCIVSQVNGRRKISKPNSYPYGTLGLFSQFIAAINNRYCLDLQPEEAERILQHGLKLKGEYADTKFAKQVYFEFVNKLFGDLKRDYSFTHDIALVGGGSLLLESIIKPKYPEAEILSNGIFANAKAFEEFGKEMWR